MPAPRLTDRDLAELLDVHAPWGPLTAVPGMSAWQARDELPLWQALEALVRARLDAPFFCIAWPGAQALAQALRQGTVDVRNRCVVDVGCGSGLAGAAAACAGASSVIVADMDALAVQAAGLLAARHGVEVTPLADDVLAHPEHVPPGAVALCADLIYNSAQAARFVEVLAHWRERGIDVVVADSGRPFFDATRFGLEERSALQVDVPASVDGRTQRMARIFTRMPMPMNVAAAVSHHTGSAAHVASDRTTRRDERTP